MLSEFTLALVFAYLDTRQSFITEYRILRRVKEQFDAFSSGFLELIPQELVNVFDERELEVRHIRHQAFLLRPVNNACVSSSLVACPKLMSTTGANIPITVATK